MSAPAVVTESVRLPDTAKCVTDAVLTRGGRIQQGWQDGDVYYVTYHYPGALNWQNVIKLDIKPAWAP